MIFLKTHLSFFGITFVSDGSRNHLKKWMDGWLAGWSGDQLRQFKRNDYLSALMTQSIALPKPETQEIHPYMYSYKG